MTSEQKLIVFRAIANIEDEVQRRETAGSTDRLEGVVAMLDVLLVRDEQAEQEIRAERAGRK